MKPGYVVLSPHPDDAVWSLGGILACLAEDSDVTIASIFDGDPLPGTVESCKSTSNRWRIFCSSGLRRDEDRRAVIGLGCAYKSLQFCDAAFRHSAQNRFEFNHIDQLFETSNFEGWPVPGELLAEKVPTILNPGDVVIAPLAMGAHIDHCITHKLVRPLANTTYWYSEFPYSAGLTEREVATHQSRLGLDLVEEVCKSDWPKWLKASLEYRSQIIRLFGRTAVFTAALKRFAQQGGELSRFRIWRNR